MRARLQLLCCSLLLALGPSAAARAQAPLEDYDSVVRQAVIEFDAGSWEEARVLFRRAHELQPNARTWRAMGLTAYELRKYVDAIGELEAALADPRKPLTQEQRSQVQTLLAKARRFVSVYRISIEPGGADVLVDGAKAELKDGQLYLDPGTHTVIVRAPGYEEELKQLSVEAGASAELQVRLEVSGQPDDEHSPAASTTSSAATEPAREMRPRIATWVLAGTALTAASVGTGLLVGGYRKHDDYESCDPGARDCDAIADKGKRLVLGSQITLGASAGLAAAAVVAFFLEGRADSRSRVALLVAPHELGVMGRF